LPEAFAHTQPFGVHGSAVHQPSVIRRTEIDVRDFRSLPQQSLRTGSGNLRYTNRCVPLVQHFAITISCLDRGKVATVFGNHQDARKRAPGVCDFMGAAASCRRTTRNQACAVQRRALGVR